MITFLKILGILYLLIWITIGGLILLGIAISATFIQSGGPQKMMGSMGPAIIQGMGGGMPAVKAR